MIIVLGLSIFIINLLVVARDSREGFESPKTCDEFKLKVENNLFSKPVIEKQTERVMIHSQVSATNPL